MLDIRWQDILDILIVAFIIYRVLLFIKGTRALELVTGIVLILFSFYLAKKLDLYTLGWILNNFVASIVLVIVVIFQNEIRRFLFVLGRSPFFSKISYVGETLFYEELVNACTLLSKKKTGALVVLEREMLLDEFMEGGVKFDADVNTELMISIFQTASPLHDGALDIKEGRVRGAGFVLPLSTKEDIAKGFGTRHRAALGITEVSDAMSVAVSEETGEISYCLEGEMVRNVNAEALKKALREFLKGKSAKAIKAAEGKELQVS
jgi:diadenylate cyclase